jgi:hypothetical protein
VYEEFFFYQHKYQDTCSQEKSVLPHIYTYQTFLTAPALAMIKKIISKIVKPGMQTPLSLMGR